MTLIELSHVWTHDGDVTAFLLKCERHELFSSSVDIEWTSALRNYLAFAATGSNEQKLALNMVAEYRQGQNGILYSNSSCVEKTFYKWLDMKESDGILRIGLINDCWD